MASFLVKDMELDWRLGAEWFESLLIDHDPGANYGNWTYQAGVGADPREDRYFLIPKQSRQYDGKGAFMRHWLGAETEGWSNEALHQPHIRARDLRARGEEPPTPGLPASKRGKGGRGDPMPDPSALQAPVEGTYPWPVVELMAVRSPRGKGGRGGGGKRGGKGGKGGRRDFSMRASGGAGEGEGRGGRGGKGRRSRRGGKGRVQHLG